MQPETEGTVPGLQSSCCKIDSLMLLLKARRVTGTPPTRGVGGTINPSGCSTTHSQCILTSLLCLLFLEHSSTLDGTLPPKESEKGTQRAQKTKIQHCLCANIVFQFAQMSEQRVETHENFARFDPMNSGLNFAMRVTVLL